MLQFIMLNIYDVMVLCIYQLIRKILTQ